MARSFVRNLREIVPPKGKEILRRLQHPAFFGTLGGVQPVSRYWGVDRGTPVDRVYIEQFIGEHRSDIRGRTLEVQDGQYTRKYGQSVTRIDVLDIDSTNPEATIVADLAAADHVGPDQFDCFVLTQTLQFIYDTEAAVRQSRRILKPNGVLLVTVPVISRLSPRYGLRSEFWRFTPASCERLFGDVFGHENISVRTYGNVLAGIAFLAGVAAEEVNRRKLEQHDEYFPLIVAVRALKGAD